MRSHIAQPRPGVTTPTQPEVLEAKIRGSPVGCQRAILGLERAPGVPTGVRRGPMWGPRDPLAYQPRRGAVELLLGRDAAVALAADLPRAARVSGAAGRGRAPLLGGDTASHL